MEIAPRRIHTKSHPRHYGSISNRNIKRYPLASRRTQVGSQAATNAGVSTKDRVNVVVVGGSFGGWTTAKRLADAGEIQLKDGGKVGIDVTLVDRMDYFEYTPGVLRALVDRSQIPTIQTSIGAGTKARLVRGEVSGLSPSHVEFHGGVDPLPYDFCVLATGASYIDPIRPNSASDFSREAREKALNSAAGELENADRVMIVGGGIVGVELAADIVWKYPQKKVEIATMDSRLLLELPEKCGDYAKGWFEKKGVSVVLDKAVDLSAVREQNPDTLIYMCVGTRCNSQVGEPLENRLDRDPNIRRGNRLDRDPNKRRRGPIAVTDTLQLPGRPNVFAVGDVMTHPCKEAKTAYTADLNGEYASQCIKAIIKDPTTALPPYPNALTGEPTVPLISCISLGKYNGLLVFNNLVLTGLYPAVIKWLVGISKIRQLKGCRFSDWLWRQIEPFSFLCHRMDRSRIRTVLPGE